MALVDTPRRKDWMSRWVHFIVDSQALGSDLSLDWETMNCLKWACMGVEAITGYNPYEAFDPADNSLREVLRTIKDRGYDNLDQIIESHYPEIPISLAQQGDLVLVAADWDGSVDTATLQVMPHGVALADPPFFWCVMPDGLGKGDLYKYGLRAFVVGRRI